MLIQDQFGIIQNLQTSPIPQTSVLVGTFFAVSYSKTALMESACCRGRVWELGVDNALSENILFHMNEAAKRDTEHSWIQFKNFCKLPWTQHFGSYIIANISVFQIISDIETVDFKTDAIGESFKLISVKLKKQTKTFCCFSFL